MSSTNFIAFATIVAASFDTLVKAGNVFVVNVPGDDLWDTYLKSYPEGTNPLFRERTEHDGSYDRSFIKRVGGVVRIDPDSLLLQTIWDEAAASAPYPYNVVAKVMQQYVVRDIAAPFFSKEPNAGSKPNSELRDGVLFNYHHFYVTFPKQYVVKSVGEKVGEVMARVGTLFRALTELTIDAAETVIELIDSGNLYRGTEFKAGAVEFLKMKRTFDSLEPWQRQLYVWVNNESRVAHLRNSAFGQLLVSLSDGEDLEKAVAAYEKMVAPTNYKRPTALITQRMIDDAVSKIDELGLRDSLDRRFATLSDVNVNDVLWVDNTVQSKMKDGLKDLLGTAVKPSEPKGKAIAIAIDKFMSDILPTAASIELFFEGRLRSNLVSLTAPVHGDAPSMFKWDNAFGWSYNGNITDSIAQQVRAAGGKIDVPLRVSLSWSNYDDLDLHCECPDGRIFYGNMAGILDVDMHRGGGRPPAKREAVENLAWRNPRNGKYTVRVNNFARVETQSPGFTVEVACGGRLWHVSKPDNNVAHTLIVEFEYKNGEIINLRAGKGLSTQGISQDVWGLSTERFVKVNTVMLSPNFWLGKQVGNKHFMFIVDGCVNDEPTRGIYNEFLKPELDKHRKVFEVLGNKTKCQPSASQLSGLGFSSTQRNEVTAKVTSNDGTRLYTIQF